MLVRVYLAYNVYSLDGFQLQIGRDKSRALSFEYVSANQRKQRDTGDQGLFPKLKLFPLRYNGGGAIERVNASKVPRTWPMARHPVPNGKGVRLGFDLLASGVPAKVKDKKIKLTIYGVNRDKVTASCRGFLKRR